MNQPEFAGNGKLHDARAEAMLHHYAVMLYDDFNNDAKVVHIENRLRDMLRNYDDNVRWGKRGEYEGAFRGTLNTTLPLTSSVGDTKNYMVENDPRE